MNNKELANLLIPNICETPEYYEALYPNRDLPDGAFVTRYAPSPTGFQHLGSIFAVIISERLAHQSNGIFYIRIEDTDKKREVNGAISDIIDVFEMFNINYDEGLSKSGSYGPYKQSLRMDIYKAYIKSLIEKGLAYPCFCTEDELSQMRKKQEELKIRTGYYGKWAVHKDKDYDYILKQLSVGKPYVIRLKSPGNPDRRILCHDLVKGNVEMPENDQDIVILKSDGLPTYHFAHAVDDHLMHTTHIVRGEEWFPSLPIHLQLFNVLGFTPPKYIHIPTLMKIDGKSKRKLSKRKDPEISINFYRQQGYLSEAVTEYLLNLVNSNYENWRHEYPDKPCSNFKIDISKISQSGALFDIEKLNDISRDIISKMSSDEVYEKYVDWLKKNDHEFASYLIDNETYSKNILGIERNIEKPRKDFSKWSDIKSNIDYFFEDYYKKDIINNFNHQNSIDSSEVNKILSSYINIYDHDDDKAAWFSKIKDLSEKLGYAKDYKTYKKSPESYKGNVSDVAGVIRTAITNHQNTPDLYEIMQVMGKDRVVGRISDLIKQTIF